jgi:hypothetical protein
MGIQYNPSIPAANDRPTNDQPIMQSNFASIKNLLDVDHIDFGNGNYGMHQWVQMPTPFSAGTTVPFPRIFTNIVDGRGNPLPGSLPQFFMYNAGTDAQSAFQNNVTAANGSVMLPMGIIVKWGTYSIAGVSNSQAVTFTNAFPNALFGVNISCITSGSIGDLEINYTPNSPSGFTGRRQGNAPTGPMYFFIAIGN